MTTGVRAFLRRHLRPVTVSATVAVASAMLVAFIADATPASFVAPQATPTVMASGIDPQVSSVRLNLPINNPATGATLRSQEIVLEGLNFREFGNANGNARAFLQAARAKIRTDLGRMPFYYTAPVVESLGETISIDRSGSVSSVPVTLTFAVELRAGGTPATAALERGFKGSAQPLGEVLASERIRVELEGMDYTNLDPSTATLDALLADIRANVLTSFGG